MKIFKPLGAALVIASLLVPLSGCGSNSSLAQKDTAIQVNNSVITTQEFNELIKFEAYADPELEITAESRDRFVEYLIQKELMIQEAMGLKLDRKQSFIKTIEKYWESTLIRNLLDVKTAELKKKILITDDEMEAYYIKNKDEFGQPYDEVKQTVKSILESKVLEEKMEEWNRGMRESADITIRIGSKIR